MSYVSPRTQFVIDDDNADDQTKVVIDGELVPFGWAPPPLGSESTFCAPFEMPLIPRAEWDDRIKDMDRYKTNASGVASVCGVKIKNQQRTNYCWAFAATQLMEVTRAYQGHPYVALSPASVAAPSTRYQNARGNPAGVGGWSSKFIDYAAQNGVCPASLWGERDINQSLDNQESRAARAGFVPTEWWNITRSFDALMTCLFTGIPVAIGLNWWSHAVSAMDPVKLDGSGRYGVRIWNSWGPQWGDNGTGVLAESKARPDDAVAVRVITAR